MMPSDDTVGEMHKDKYQSNDRRACVEPIACAYVEGSPEREPCTPYACSAAACAWRVSATKSRICCTDHVKTNGDIDFTTSDDRIQYPPEKMMGGETER